MKDWVNIEDLGKHRRKVKLKKKVGNIKSNIKIGYSKVKESYKKNAPIVKKNLASLQKHAKAWDDRMQKSKPKAKPKGKSKGGIMESTMDWGF